MKRISYSLLLLAVACSQAPTAASPPDEMADLRRLHARYLERGPTVDDLSDDERIAFVYCRNDPESEHCRWAKENLNGEQWESIERVEAEIERQTKEMERQIDACARRDEMLLRSMYPGHLAFYEQVISLPPYDQPRTDAIVVVTHGAPSMRPIRKLLDAGEADMALRVQVHSGGSGIYPSRNSTKGEANFHYGWFTPEIERRMKEPRPDCDSLKNSAFRQSACRRDLTLSIVRDWMEAHGHQSVRLRIPDQVSWPEYALVAERVLPEFEVHIDDDFSKKLKRETSFLVEMCWMTGDNLIWAEYESYLRRLFGER